MPMSSGFRKSSTQRSIFSTNPTTEGHQLCPQLLLRGYICTFVFISAVLAASAGGDVLMYIASV